MVGLGQEDLTQSVLTHGGTECYDFFTLTAILILTSGAFLARLRRPRNAPEMGIAVTLTLV
jgi:hypothetical protein